MKRKAKLFPPMPPRLARALAKCKVETIGDLLEQRPSDLKMALSELHALDLWMIDNGLGWRQLAPVPFDRKELESIRERLYITEIRLNAVAKIAEITRSQKSAREKLDAITEAIFATIEIPPQRLRT